MGAKDRAAILNACWHVRYASRPHQRAARDRAVAELVAKASEALERSPDAAPVLAELVRGLLVEPGR